VLLPFLDIKDSYIVSDSEFSWQQPHNLLNEPHIVQCDECASCKGFYNHIHGTE
jgi:hypothetical protein